MGNIIFIGMPSAGKSTVGVVLAKRLGLQFIDADIVIQEKEGKLLKEIILEKGTDGFLELEDRINSSIEADHAVISPGGSIVYCKNAMRHYKEIGTVVYLQVSYDIINQRLKNSKDRGVVLRQGQTFRSLYDERIRLFEKYADVTVCEDGLNLEETVGKIMEILPETVKYYR